MRRRPPDAGRPLVVATRGSPLALWQAHHVKGLLERRGHAVRLALLKTTGDIVLDQPLAKVGGKGLFLKEIEQALAQGDADLAVHSLKDVPMQMPEGFSLAAVLQREDPRDGLVARDGLRLRELPAGARVGTSSLRRAMMLRAQRPDLDVAFVRGNVEGRLAKLDRGEFDAIVLAVAGLRRLALEARLSEIFEAADMLPAVGQGAIGIEILAARHDLAARLEPLEDRRTRLCVSAEREAGRLMHASCSEPFAAHAQFSGDEMVLRATWGGAAGGPLSTQTAGTVRDCAAAERLGRAAAEGLLAR